MPLILWRLNLQPSSFCVVMAANWTLGHRVVVNVDSSVDNYRKSYIIHALRVCVYMSGWTTRG